MSEEQLKAFLEAVKVDADLQEKLKEATDSDEVIAIASSAGFLISTKDLQRPQENISEQQLEELVVGGMSGINCPGGATQINYQNTLFQWCGSCERH